MRGLAFDQSAESRYPVIGISSSGGTRWATGSPSPSMGRRARAGSRSPHPAAAPAVVVIQEWWGLVPHVMDVTESFAHEGFLAFAPDLYHGRTTTSPDEAGRLLMELDVERAGREIAGAGAYLLQRPDCSSKKFGVVGFCMGGALAQYAATTNPNVGAAVSFYGGFKKVPVEWKYLASPLLLDLRRQGHGRPGVRREAPRGQAPARSARRSRRSSTPRRATRSSTTRARTSTSRGLRVDAWTRTLAHLRGALV